MKTVDQIQDEINKIREEVQITRKTTPKQKIDVEMLLLFKLYLGTNPKKSFVNSEIDRLSKTIEYPEGDECFSAWCWGRKKMINPRKEYENYVRLPHLKQQLKALMV